MSSSPGRCAAAFTNAKSFRLPSPTNNNISPSLPALLPQYSFRLASNSSLP